MKRLLKILLMMTVPVLASAATGPQTVLNSTVTYNVTPGINLNAYGLPQNHAKNLSAQITFSSVTFPTDTFFDGSQSTGSLTVVSTQTLVALTATDSITVPSTSSILGSPATNQITIVSTTALAGTQATFTTILTNYSDIAATSPTITLNGLQTYTYGSATWASTDTIQHAAATLAAGINAGANYTAAVVSSTGVIITANPFSTVANGWVVNSSSITDISTGTFSGGANPVTVTITLPSLNQTLAYTYGGNWVSSDTVTHAAATLASVVNIGSTIDATNTAGVIYASATLIGTLGNAYTITTSSAALVSVSSSSFLGGLNPALLGASFTLGANIYQRGIDWTDVSGTSTGTALSITNFINSVSTQNAVAGGGIENVIATQAGSVINLVTATTGVANNSIVLTSTGPYGALTIGTPTFVGGQSNASITINGTTLTLGTDFPTPLASSTTANLATAIATAMNANARLSPLISAQAVASVVNSTSTTTGTAANYTTVSSTQSQLSFANATMTGGTTSAVTLNSGVISLPAHGFAACLPVVYTTGTVAIGGLTNNTTYYPVIIDANDVGLSSTSAVCQTGNYITITSTNTQTSTHTYTLTPTAFSQGSAGGFWQISNDGINWATFGPTINNVTVSSQTYTPVFPNASSMQDWGQVDFGYLRYKVTAPTAGGVAVQAIINAKD